MDPLTHSVLGMAVAVLITPRKQRRRPAALAGLAAGLLPDADVFLRSASDPLFTLEYHRHFTHSLIFSPVIALFGACIASSLYALFKKRLDWKTLYLPAWLAGLSHLFCDLWTSYGTQIWWPFSNHRAALDWISVIDPLFTVPAAACVALAVRYASRKTALAALTWAAVYLLFCIVQQHRATAAVKDWLAKENLPVPERMTVRPSFGNALVWRGLTVQNGVCQAVAIRCGWPGDVRLTPGQSAPLLSLSPPDSAFSGFGLPPDSVQARDILRFARFSDGWIGTFPGQPDIIGDLRYASVPDEIKPLWGIRLNPADPTRHAEFLNFPAGGAPSLERLWDMMKGKAKTEPKGAGS